MAKPKLKLGYDNLEDAKGKLLSTYCLYQGKSIMIRTVDHDPEDQTKFVALGTYFEGPKKSTPIIKLDDPAFNCSDYNIGYLNVPHGAYATWLYRIPHKQYAQGLRSNQIGFKASNPAYGNFDMRASAPLAAMLENRYPKFTEVVKVLDKGNMHLMAFNRNFAMSKDVIHNDYLLEYKGQQIGYTTDLKDFKLLQEHEHLHEALKEATQQ